MSLRIRKELGKKSVKRNRDYYKKFIFVFEGEKTEKQYFSEIKNNKNELGINGLIYIELLDKDDETQSNQLKVVENLDEYIKNIKLMRESNESVKKHIKEFLIKNMSQYKEKLTTLLDVSFISDNYDENIEKFFDLSKKIINNTDESNKLNIEMDNLKEKLEYEEDIDKICIIIDRDKGSFKEFQYDKVLEICKENGYILGISNPSFEFWLLLHLTNAKQYNTDEIRINKKVKKSKNSPTYIEKLLSDELGFRYKKNEIKFDLFKDNIDIAINNQKLYESNIDNLKNNIGTNVGDIIQYMRGFEK